MWYPLHSMHLEIIHRLDKIEKTMSIAPESKLIEVFSPQPIIVVKS